RSRPHRYAARRRVITPRVHVPGVSPTLPSDVSGSAKYYERDVIVPPVETTDGYVPIPTQPGLGFAIDTAWIAANSLATSQIEE
ncbi:MAG: hypothetical protein ACYC1E_17890, partial [Propionibacteriaceae bacterium]